MASWAAELLEDTQARRLAGMLGSRGIPAESTSQALPQHPLAWMGRRVGPEQPLLHCARVTRRHAWPLPSPLDGSPAAAAGAVAGSDAGAGPEESPLPAGGCLSGSPWHKKTRSCSSWPFVSCAM